MCNTLLQMAVVALVTVSLKMATANPYTNEHKLNKQEDSTSNIINHFHEDIVVHKYNNDLYHQMLQSAFQSNEVDSEFDLINLVEDLLEDDEGKIKKTLEKLKRKYVANRSSRVTRDLEDEDEEEIDAVLRRLSFTDSVNRLHSIKKIVRN